MEPLTTEDWIFDFGNSRTKLGLPQSDGSWNVRFDGEALEMAQLRLHSDVPPPSILWTATGDIPPEWKQWRAVAEQRWGTRHFHPLTGEWTPPFRLEIDGQSTLGVDRLAHAAAAIQADPEATWFIVDAGTVLVCDLVVEGCFKGGTLSPGWDMRFKSLYEGTAGLPWIAGWRHMIDKAHVRRDSHRDLWGRDTMSAILNGVAGGIEEEVRGRLAGLACIYPQIKVVVTGGDGDYLHIPHRGTIFADPFFTLRGFHIILRQIAQLP